MERNRAEQHGRIARSGCRARDKTAQRWAQEGLTALRASREEFPIEVTLSPFEVGGERCYTLILRDVNERNRIEADLQALRLERSYLTE